MGQSQVQSTLGPPRIRLVLALLMDAQLSWNLENLDALTSGLKGFTASGLVPGTT